MLYDGVTILFIYKKKLTLPCAVTAQTNITPLAPPGTACPPIVTSMKGSCNYTIKQLTSRLTSSQSNLCRIFMKRRYCTPRIHSTVATISNPFTSSNTAFPLFLGVVLGWKVHCVAPASVVKWLAV